MKLAVTAQQINDAHEKAQGSAKSAVTFAVECGQLLTAKKAELRHGEFDAWIAENCNFERSTATRYMKAAKQIATGVAISKLSDLFGADKNQIESKPHQKQKKTADKPEPDPNTEHTEFVESVDLIKELEHSAKEIDVLNARVESLKKDDLAKEVDSLSMKYAQLEGRLQGEITSGNEARKQAKWQTKLLAEIRKLLGVEKNTEILPKIKGLMK